MSPEPYRVLVELAEREQAMVLDGRFDELAALAAERRTLIATMPAEAPVAARPALERALSLQRATTAALEQAVERARVELGAMDRRHHAVRAYAAA